MIIQYLNQIKQLESAELKAIAYHLAEQRFSVTSFGKAWSKATNNWIYFDTYLDLDELRTQFNLGEHIVEHKNTDPKSGTEHGFIDTSTGEALMGRLKQDQS